MKRRCTAVPLLAGSKERPSSPNHKSPIIIMIVWLKRLKNATSHLKHSNKVHGIWRKSAKTPLSVFLFLQHNPTL